MAKTLRTSGDYTIKAGSGSAGTNTIKLDSNNVRVTGNFTVDGDQVVQNVTNTTIEDQFIELNRNNSTAGTEDSGIIFNGGSSDNAILLFDASANEFIAATTATNFQDGSSTKFEVAVPGSLTYRHLKVATTPSDDNHAASKNYVDSLVGSGFSLKVAGDDSTQITVATGNTLKFAGTNGISTTGAEPDTITISLANNLTDIHSITNSSTNADLTLSANSNGSVVIDDVLTFNTNRSGEPTATAVTKMFAQTPSGGGTGVFFVNTAVSSGAAGELISKKKATALAIALG